MLEKIFKNLLSNGSTEAKNILISAGKKAIKKIKSSNDLEKVFVNIGSFFMKHEKDKSSLFDSLEQALSSENMIKISSNLNTDDGYSLKEHLHDSIMSVLIQYDIPFEYAESYTYKILYTIIEQIREVDPEKYEQYFLKEWRDEENAHIMRLQKRIDSIAQTLSVINREKENVFSLGEIDLELRRSTQNPTIGIDFFKVDDEHFQDEFESHCHDESVYIKGRSREETVYCILNELRRLNDSRPIYVIKSLESWNKLRLIPNNENVFIPWFNAEEIIPIEHNTNIFVLDDNIPAFNKKVYEIRPRTQDTIVRCLVDAGMDHEGAYSLVRDTHGLYIQIKKQIFNGEYCKKPSWIDGINDKAKKTCLLIGSWEEFEGDKLVVEALYGDTYESFMNEIVPYTKGDDPFIYIVKYNGTETYCLASTENVWSYLDVAFEEPIWNMFVKVFIEVLNESETLFSYEGHERLIAQIKGERLFWSETIRKGMLKTMLIKGAYKNVGEAQEVFDKVASEILGYVRVEKQWFYISRFWKELCEISPVTVLNRLDKEFDENTGLISLFENQKKDFLFERNAYIDILWGIEQFLVQKDFFWRAFRWLLKLDSRNYEYVSNSPKDIMAKIFCTWMDFTALKTTEEKINAAKLTFELDRLNAWEIIYSSLESAGRSILGNQSVPQYRVFEVAQPTTIGNMQNVQRAYLELLLKNTDFSVDRWLKMITLSEVLWNEARERVFEQLLYDVVQMSDEEITKVKNDIRKLLYRHRYFSSSGWALSEDILEQYEKLLDDIKCNTPEYEYSYLFNALYDCPILHPIPYESEGELKENDRLKEKLIRESIKEFENKKLNLSKLVHICANEDHSSIGKYLAKYWNEGLWDDYVIKVLIENQDNGVMAVDYISWTNIDEKDSFNNIFDMLYSLGCTDNVLAKAYRIEAARTKSIPLVDNASESIKKEFWTICCACDESNTEWAINECKKYATIDIFLEQIHMLNFRKPLNAQYLFDSFKNIEEMPYSGDNNMTGYYIEQLLSILQEAFMDNYEKSIRISHLEIFFMNVIDWSTMRCFQRMIKESPELLAEIVDTIYKHDHQDNITKSFEDIKFRNMYTLYEKACFCPMEKNGVVREDKLKEWVERYRELLEQNDQKSLFGFTIGRFLAFSPVGKDGHSPCEAVRKIIEEYGDDDMIDRYQMTIYNNRGVYSPSAGKDEYYIAEKFKANAQFLEPNYPNTSKIFYGLYKRYLRESDRERQEAENGIF